MEVAAIGDVASGLLIPDTHQPEILIFVSRGLLIIGLAQVLVLVVVGYAVISSWLERHRR